MNNKFKKSQVLVLSLLTILLIIAPLLSSSRRPTYLYFITNLLIIAVGAEAGLLSFFAKPSLDHNNNITIDHRKINTNNNNNNNNNNIPSELASLEKRAIWPNIGSNDREVKVGGSAVGQSGNINSNIRVVEKCLSEKVFGNVVKEERVKKCPSMPSLFFIGGGDNEGDLDQVYDDQDDDDDEQEEVGEISGQELFAKAENFIGNFYKQLKMQREESWKRIHGFYQRAF